MAQSVFEPVDSRVDFPAMESRIQEWWRKNDIFRRSVEQRPEDNLFSFYEGPPTANGSPGLHHVISRCFKDIINRYQAMKGKRVPRKGGWDTHGLPVEIEVEKALGFNSKREIEQYGIEAFNKKCRESVQAYVEDWVTMTDRIAFWVDMDDPYWTYDNEYIESCWWIIKTLWDKGLVYQDYRSTPHCPRCGTSLSDHELAQGYEENTVDPSVFPKFRVLSGSDALRLADGVPTFLLAWTTTPWTLPANTALAVDNDADYVLVDQEGERLIVASALLDRVLPERSDAVTRLKGSDLVGASYEGLYNPEDWGVQARRFEAGRLVNADLKDVETSYRVYATDFVSMDDGTGIVHIAPAFGSEDFETGKREGLLFLGTVDLRGNMPAGSPWGEVFVKDADPKITKDLQDRGLMLRAGTVKHTYPFCWRCGTPVLYIAKPTWYIKTTQVKDRLLEANQRINWYPAHTKNGRFGNWLENNIDWAVSRERYWGTPLPVWVCQQCDHRDAVGSIKELRDKAVDRTKAEALTDLHRPYIDEIWLRCSECGGEMKRAPEVLDAWYDSGAMPYAQWHYPFENDDKFDERFPADFICEAVDQTRGWFYTLHAEAALLNYAAPELVPEPQSFKNVICLGLILDAKGEKMSKSRGNAVDPWDVINKSGADALRWYLYTATAAGEPRRFSSDQVQETLRKFLLTLWNTYSFFVTYARIDDFRPSGKSVKPESELDRWLLSELNLLVDHVTRDMDAYNPTDAGRAMARFVDDLSNWYVRRSRRRFWKSESDADKQEAYETLYAALTTLSKLLAPFTPFVAEEIYRNLVATADPQAPESVHLADWPRAEKAMIDEGLTQDLRLVKRLINLGLRARSLRAGKRVRQPLGWAAFQVQPWEVDVVQRWQNQIAEELNVKEVEFLPDVSKFFDYEIKPSRRVLGPMFSEKLPQVEAAIKAEDPAELGPRSEQVTNLKVGPFEIPFNGLSVETVPKGEYAVDALWPSIYKVVLSTSISPELEAEGWAREIVHRLQDLRKNAGFEIADRIVSYITDPPDAIRAAVDLYGDYLRQETLSEVVSFDPPDESAYVKEQTVDGYKLKLAVRKS